MTLFLDIHQVFLFLSSFIVSDVVSNVVYDPFFTTKSPLSTKNSLATPISLLCSSFRAHPTTLLLKILGRPMHGPFPPPQILGAAHPTTLLLKILGGPMHGPSPHLKFLGGPSPLGLRLWYWCSQYFYSFSTTIQCVYLLTTEHM